MFAALPLSALVSMETGEDQEHAVEAVVTDAALDTHEDAAEQFLWLSMGMLGVSAAGVLTGRIGTAARALATVGSLGLLAAGYRVGHSGGELVFKYGAASAYTRSAVSGATASAPTPESDDR